jgi:hypothetical protein
MENLKSPSHARRVELFGSIDYTPAPVKGNPERVVISGTWVRDHLVSVSVPQLARFGVKRPVSVHKLAAKPLQVLWAAWESNGLLEAVESYDGLWVPRFKRGSGTESERAARCKNLTASSLSNHSWGTAFDVNARSLPLGTRLEKVPEAYLALEESANDLGWFWGGRFVSRPDPQHWELARL